MLAKRGPQDATSEILKVPTIRKIDSATYELTRPSSSGFGLARLFADARVVASYQNGVFAGLKMFSIRPGTVLDQLGLQNGDTLVEIDGHLLYSTRQFLALLDGSSPKTELTLRISRFDSRTISWHLN